MERNRRGRPRHPDVLTPAEWRVLDALRDGGANAEVAARLGLSPDTVKTHISNMLAKLELRDRRALAAWRPDAPRRLGGVLALPAAVWSAGRPLLPVAAGAATLAGVVAVAVALVALEGIVEGDGGLPAAVAPSPAPTTADASSLPSPPPAVTPRPTPTVTPAPAPGPVAGSAAADPTTGASQEAPPCDGIECIVVRAPDAFEHRTWEPPFDSVEWDDGAFVLDTQTGRIHGYRAGQHENGSYHVLSHGWVHD